MDDGLLITDKEYKVLNMIYKQTIFKTGDYADEIHSLSGNRYIQSPSCYSNYSKVNFDLTELGKRKLAEYKRYRDERRRSIITLAVACVSALTAICSIIVAALC